MNNKNTSIYFAFRCSESHSLVAGLHRLQLPSLDGLKKKASAEPFTKRFLINSFLASLPTVSAQMTSFPTSEDTGAPEAKLYRWSLSASVKGFVKF